MKKLAICFISYIDDFFVYNIEHLIGKSGRIHSKLLKKTQCSKIQYRRHKKQSKVTVEHKDKSSAEQAILEVQKHLVRSAKRKKKKK